jgi:hypothetical protein
VDKKGYWLGEAALPHSQMGDVLNLLYCASLRGEAASPLSILKKNAAIE